MYYRWPNNAKRGANARDTGERERIALSPPRVRTSRRNQRPRRERETAKEDGRKAEKRSRLPLSHARALRHFDTSDTSFSFSFYFSPVKPTPRFSPLATHSFLLSRTLCTLTREYSTAPLIYRGSESNRFDCLAAKAISRVRPRAFLSRRDAPSTREPSSPTGVSRSGPVPLSLLSLVTARREFSSAGHCASSDGDCAPKPKQRTTLPSGAPLAVAPPIRRTRRRLAQRAQKRALRSRTGSLLLPHVAKYCKSSRIQRILNDKRVINRENVRNSSHVGHRKSEIESMITNDRIKFEKKKKIQK